MRVLIDGVPVENERATIPVFDWALQRGYGCFEVLRSYRGRVFRLDRHLHRLAASCDHLLLPRPDLGDVARWVEELAAGEDALVRVLVTAGSRDPDFTAAGRVVVIREGVPQIPDPFRVVPLDAPWTSGGDHSELTGAKTLSYAPNMLATMEAQRLGYDDALLVSRHGHVLEGPTFCAAWIRDGVMETPALDLGILASITREAAIETARSLDIPVREGRFALRHVMESDEVLALSTVKEVRSVAAVGETAFPPGPVTTKLAAAFAALVTAETTV